MFVPVIIDHVNKNNYYIVEFWRTLIKQICEYKCQIFSCVLVQCPFDLLTVTFQGQTFFDSSRPPRTLLSKGQITIAAKEHGEPKTLNLYNSHSRRYYFGYTAGYFR